MSKLLIFMTASEQPSQGYNILKIKSVDRLVVKSASNRDRKDYIHFFKRKKIEDKQIEVFFISKFNQPLCRKKKKLKNLNIKKERKNYFNIVDYTSISNRYVLCYSQLIVAAYQANPMRIRTLPSKRYQCRCKKYFCSYCMGTMKNLIILTDRDA